MSEPLTLLQLSDKLARKAQTKGVLVMDGDWLVFQAMVAAEFDASWEEEVWHRCCDHAKAREILYESIKAYASRKKVWAGAPIVLAFTDRINWRKVLVDPTYKENRAVVKKPVGYFEFLDSVWSDPQFLSVLEERLEGDDCMGIIASNPAQFNTKKVVLVSCDKDFKTIPGCDFLHCTTGEIYTQDMLSATYWHMYQTMKGDITDGYGGIPGCGEKFVEEFLEEPYKFVQETTVAKSGKNKGQEVTKWVKTPRDESDSLWDCIVTVAAKAGMTEDEVIAQARMARILRACDYDIQTREITLWDPEK